MRHAVWGVLIGAGLVMLVLALAPNRNPVFAQNAGTDPSGSLITHVFPAGEGLQDLLVIDPRTRSMCVYQVKLASGEVALRSVRQFHWDLQMTEFNGVKPLPQEIRRILQQ